MPELRTPAPAKNISQELDVLATTARLARCFASAPAATLHLVGRCPPHHLPGPSSLVLPALPWPRPRPSSTRGGGRRRRAPPAPSAWFCDVGHEPRPVSTSFGVRASNPTFAHGGATSASRTGGRASTPTFVSTNAGGRIKRRRPRLCPKLGSSPPLSSNDSWVGLAFLRGACYRLTPGVATFPFSLLYSLLRGLLSRANRHALRVPSRARKRFKLCWFFHIPVPIALLQYHAQGSGLLVCVIWLLGLTSLESLVSSPRDHRPPLQLLPGSYDACGMFDGMPPGNRGKEHEGECPEVEGDHINALPDVLLNDVLSLLPAEEVVRTCVLARRWRHLWKSTAGLRIGYLGKYEAKSVNALNKFVENLLLLRGGLPLDKFMLRLGGFSGPNDVPRVNHWLRHAVTCKVRVLKIHVLENEYVDPWLELDDLPLVSKHLTRLQLGRVQCPASFLNFSGCPALEHLEFVYCDLSLTKKISSEFLKCLRITDSVFAEDSRIRICAPNLVSLNLDDLWFHTPILESMPRLVKAFVRITEQCWDRCSKLWDPNQDCDCESCDGSDSTGDGGDKCVLLQGLSEAKDLMLISELDMFIFKRDLLWCPMFSKLRTLLLNEYWCMPDDCGALACILEHSPVLESLTLELFSKGPMYKVEMKGSFTLGRSATISEHLNIVKVRCQDVNEGVLKVLKFLCTFDLRFSF